MANTIIQAVVSVLVLGIILALLTKKLSQKGPKLVYYVSAATWFTNIQPASRRHMPGRHKGIEGIDSLLYLLIYFTLHKKYE